VPERTPEAKNPRPRLENPGHCDIPRVMVAPRELSPSASTAESMEATIALHSPFANSSTQVFLQSPFVTSSPSSPSRGAKRPIRKPQGPPAIGSPVTFYVDGHVNAYGRDSLRPYVGWLKAVSPYGLHTVDLVGGGRMAGLEMVTPCSTEELRKAAQLKRPLDCSDDAYAVYDIRNKERTRSLSPCEKFVVGAAVSFCLEKHERCHSVSLDYPERFYGHVHKQCDDGCYIIDLVGGGRKIGVRRLTACTERDLVKTSQLKHSLITRTDSSASLNTPNAPAWGGGSGYSAGYREGSSFSRARSPGLARSSSSLDLSASHQTDLTQKRSLSPQLCRSGEVSGRQEFVEGCPVQFCLEGRPHACFGRIHRVDANGTFTVDMVGGRRIVGLWDLTSCSVADLENAHKGKMGTITRRNAWDELSTRNRPPSRSPSPVPHLRGIAINLPPRSVTRLSLS